MRSTHAEAARFLAGRLVWSLLVLWLVASATFALVMVIPADPARALVGPHGGPDAVAEVRHALCLDRALPVQYGCFVGRLARGDLGTSFRTGRPVAELLGERAWPTAQLALAALLVGLGAGVPMGMLATLRRGRLGDHGVFAFTLAAQSAPAFFLGPLLLYLLAYGAGLFPIAGYGAPGLDRLWHLALPAVTLGAGVAALYARVARAELIEVMASGHVRAARAKGLSPAQVMARHGLRNVAIPLVSLIGVDLGALLGGAVVTENVFAWPGLGREAVLAIQDLDLPVILGIVVFGAVAVVVTSLVVDVAATLLDPRVGLE